MPPRAKIHSREFQGPREFEEFSKRIRSHQKELSESLSQPISVSLTYKKRDSLVLSSPFSRNQAPEGHTFSQQPIKSIALIKSSKPKIKEKQRPSNGKHLQLLPVAPMMLGVAFMGFLRFFQNRKTQKLLPAAKEENSLIKIERKVDQRTALDKNGRPLFEEMDAKVVLKKIGQGVRDLQIDHFLGGMAIGVLGYLLVGPAFGLASGVGITFLSALKNAKMHQSLTFPGLRRQQVGRLLLAENKAGPKATMPPGLEQIQSLHETTGFSYELLVARALQTKEGPEFSVWAEFLFGNKLGPLLEWIRRGELPQGIPVLLHLLKVDKLSEEETGWVLNTLVQLKAEEALPIIQKTKNNYEETSEEFKKFEKAEIGLMISLDRAHELEAAKLGSFYKDRGLDITKNLFKMRIFEGLKISKEFLKETFGSNFQHYKKSLESLIQIYDTYQVKPPFPEKPDPQKEQALQRILEQMWDPNSTEPKFMEARVVGKMGFYDSALQYLERLHQRTDLSGEQKLELAISFYDLNQRDTAIEIAKDLLLDPLVEFEAAKLMDQLALGWDHFVPKMGSRSLGPFR